MSAWNLYNLGTTQSNIGISPPLQCSDGNMWAAAPTGTDGVCFTVQTPGGGAPSPFFVGPSANSTQEVSNLITDGTNVFVTQATNFPHALLVKVVIATKAGANVLDGSNYSPGLVNAGAYAIATGSNVAISNAQVNQWNLPAGSYSTFNNLGAGLGTFGGAVWDGAIVWTPLMNTNEIYAVNPSTLTGPSYTLAGTLPGTAAIYQIGFDGRFIYMAAAGGGVIIFDTVAHTSSVVGATLVQNCYYSANLGAVVVDDSARNIYTMPAGSGSSGVLTPIGNKDTITGNTIIAGGGPGSISGFGDGPNHTLWGSGSQSANGFSFLFSTTKSGNPIRLLL